MSGEFRILVTGSRNWVDAKLLHRVLGMYILCGKIYTANPAIVIVHGKCPIGADRIADEYARRNGIAVDPHPAQWHRYGKSAGPKRNSEMIALGADVCLAFIRNHSSGATDCAEKAEKAGIVTKIFRCELGIAVYR